MTDLPQAPRERVLSFMVSLCFRNGDMRAAEGYLLELLAHCAFAEHDLANRGPKVSA